MRSGEGEREEVWIRGWRRSGVETVRRYYVSSGRVRGKKKEGSEER